MTDKKGKNEESAGGGKLIDDFRLTIGTKGILRYAQNDWIPVWAGMTQPGAAVLHAAMRHIEETFIYIPW